MPSTPNRPWTGAGSSRLLASVAAHPLTALDLRRESKHTEAHWGRHVWRVQVVVDSRH